MNGLEKDAQLAVQTTKAWRAQYLCTAADRLDIHIEKLKAQAAEYRELARQLNPTQS